MGLSAQLLNMRLFVDGLEVPVIGAQGTFSEGAFASAQIQVIATDEIYDIEPRAFITLYVYNSSDLTQGVDGVSDMKVGPRDARRWVLFYAGEMTSISMNKQASGKSATITCAGLTNYWDFIRQQYINFSNGGVEMIEAAFLGLKLDRLKFFDVPTQGTDSKLYTWLIASKNAQGQSSLYLGVQRVIREMFFSVNDFYSEAFNRLRLGDVVVGLPDDQTAAKLFKLQSFDKFIKNRTGGAGGMTTVRALLGSLLGPVFHTYVTIPFPKFDRKGEALGSDLKANTAANKNLAASMISRKHSWPGASLNYTLIKPDTWFLSPPACNVVFPHQYNSLSYGRNYLAEPTRLFMRTSLMMTGRDKWMTERFYSPDFEALNTVMYKTGGYLQRLSSTLMAHEEFVGINPMQVWQEDLAAYVQKGARRDYLARLTDYLYWKYKFGTRQVNVSGPLNMNLIPGYPAVVLDRVDSEAGKPRHYIGNIANIVHSITQQGGITSFTLVGARVHTEVVDFDGKGRSLEAITTRGTDGFLDDRYNPETIGKEVYQKLFGCDSIVDAFQLISGAVVPTTADPTSSPIRDAIDAIAESYRMVASSGGDISAFVERFTDRPKANFVEMMGLSAALKGDSNQSSASSITANAVRATDPQAYAAEGFFSSAVDPDSLTVKEATYTASDGKTPGKYLLDIHLRARQSKVAAYVNSLRYKGMRG